MTSFAFWIWLISGIILVLLEFLFPGFVVIFIGIASLLVAALHYFTIIDSFLHSILIWMGSSIVLLIFLRTLILRLFPSHSHTNKECTNEDKQMIGLLCEVVESITPNKPGRVRFQETTWVALTDSTTNIEVGEKVKIVGRDNTSLIVQKI